MSKDHHLKRQKQIRMDDDLRQRFDKARAKSKLPSDKFVEALLDAYERKNEINWPLALRRLASELEDKA